MPENIIIRGLDEIIERLRRKDEKVKQGTKVAMDASLLVLWQNVPPYPNKPEDSNYDRTGTLGRTLGSGEGGGQSALNPTIYEVREMGEANYEGHFGTDLNYAPSVIGDEDQAWMHRGRWWQMHDIREKAQERIEKIFQMLGDKVKSFIEGNTLD